MASFFDVTLGKETEFRRVLADAGFTVEIVDMIIKTPSLARKMLDTIQAHNPSDRFAWYAPLLRTLDEQKALLLKLNGRMPRLQRVPLSWFTNLGTKSDHIQTVEDLEFFFVVPGMLEETWYFNQRLIEFMQPSISVGTFDRDEKHLRLDPNAVTYKPGIHRVRINLVDNWLPGIERSVDVVRHRAATSGRKLAGIEAIGAYGLQDPKLLQSQNGETLPFCDLAGLQQGDSFSLAPSLQWKQNILEADFDVWESKVPDDGSAAPTILKY